MGGGAQGARGTSGYGFGTQLPWIDVVAVGESGLKAVQPLSLPKFSNRVAHAPTDCDLPTPSAGPRAASYLPALDALSAVHAARGAPSGRHVRAPQRPYQSAIEIIICL